MLLVRKKNQPMISQIFGLDNTTVEATSFLPEITCTGLYINKNNRLLYKILTLVVYLSKSHKSIFFNLNYLEDLFVTTRSHTIDPTSQDAEFPYKYSQGLVV